MTNPFLTEEAWEVSTDTILTAGDHATKVQEAEKGISSGGYPQVIVKTGNDTGQIRDWLVITPRSIGKIVQLTDALGVPRPTDEDIADTETYELTDAYVAAWVGKPVGTIVRSEPDQKNPGQTRDRVAGYVPVSQIAGQPGSSDVSNDGFAPPVQDSFGGMESSGVQNTGQNAIDDDIPF